MLSQIKTRSSQAHVSMRVRFSSHLIVDYISCSKNCGKTELVLKHQQLTQVMLRELIKRSLVFFCTILYR